MANTLLNILLENRRLGKLIKIVLMGLVLVLVSFGFVVPKAKSQSSSPTIISQIPYNESRIQGYVTEKTTGGGSAYLSGANVYSQQNGQNISLGQTDSTGYYLSPLLPSGQYNLTAQKANYDLTSPVTVDTSKAGQSDNFDDNLINSKIWPNVAPGFASIKELNKQLTMSGTNNTGGTQWPVITSSPYNLNDLVFLTKIKVTNLPAGNETYLGIFNVSTTWTNLRSAAVAFSTSGWRFGTFNGSVWTWGSYVKIGNEASEFKTIKIIINSSQKQVSGYIINTDGKETLLGSKNSYDLSLGGTVNQLKSQFWTGVQPNNSFNISYDDYQTYLSLEILPNDVIQQDDFNNNSLNTSLWNANNSGPTGLKVQETGSQIQMTGINNGGSPWGAVAYPSLASSTSTLDDEMLLTKVNTPTLPAGNEAAVSVYNNGTFATNGTLRGVTVAFNSTTGWRFCNLVTSPSIAWNCTNPVKIGNEVTEYKVVKIFVNNSQKQISASVFNANGQQYLLGSFNYDLSAGGATNQIKSQLSASVLLNNLVTIRFDDYNLFKPHYKTWANDLVMQNASSIQPGFTDVPTNYWAFWQIQAISQAGITAGCSNDQTGTQFCPDSPVTRAQMATFLIKAMKQNPVQPCQGIFADVPTSNQFCGFIEKIYQLGITSGCSAGPLKYCPNDPVTRGQMAAFLEKAINGQPYNNPTPTFADVPVTHPFYSYIEALYRDKITTGCSIDPTTKKPNYCPTTQVTRGAMAVFLVNAFKIPWGEGKIQGYVKDSDAKFVTNAKIEIQNTDETWTEKATTDSTGYFIIKSLDPGKEYILRAQKSSPMYIYKNTVKVTTKSGNVITWSDDLIVKKAGKLQGKVYIGSQDHPVKGVRIKVHIEPYDYFGESDDTGDYWQIIPVVDETMFWAGYKGYDSIVSKTATIKFNEVTNLDFDLGQDFPASIHGHVYNSDGSLVTNTGIIVEDGDNNYYAYIDENGEYSLPGVPPGYELEILFVKEDGYFYPTAFPGGLIDFPEGDQTYDFHGLTKVE